jgi:hypothetical protein
MRRDLLAIEMTGGVDARGQLGLQLQQTVAELEARSPDSDSFRMIRSNNGATLSPNVPKCPISFAPVGARRRFSS